MKQKKLFDGDYFAQVGMDQAEDHANEVEPNWSQQAYDFLLKYCKTNSQFMAEDVREAADGIVPKAPTSRAWGGIFRKAAFNGLIHRLGYQKVKNIKAHSTPATFWGSSLCVNGGRNTGIVVRECPPIDESVKAELKKAGRLSAGEAAGREELSNPKNLKPLPMGSIILFGTGGEVKSTNGYLDSMYSSGIDPVTGEGHSVGSDEII